MVDFAARWVSLSLLLVMPLVAACGDDTGQAGDIADGTTPDSDDAIDTLAPDTADAIDTLAPDTTDTHEPDDADDADTIDTAAPDTADARDTHEPDDVDTIEPDDVDTADTIAPDISDDADTFAPDTADDTTEDTADTTPDDTADTTLVDTTPPDPCAAPAPDCTSGLGLCAFGVSRCDSQTGWSACDYGAAHEDDEHLCDGFDNDCDGTTDEGCACPVQGACGARTLSRLDLADDAGANTWAIEQRAGGDLAFAGELSDGGALIGVTTLGGAPVWLQGYRGGSRPVFRDLEPLPDGGLIAAGWVDLPAPAGREVLVARLDASGAIVWAQTYGTTGNDAAYGLDVRGQRAVLAGEVGQAMLFLELDLDGALVDAKTLKVGTSIEHARDVTFGVDGRVVVFGESYDNTGRAPVLVDPETRAASLVASHDAISSRIRPTRDGGFLLSGLVYGYEGDTGVAYTAKLDKDFARVFFVTQNESYAMLYDTVELTGGGLLGGGSNAWAMVVAYDANGTARGGSVYRPLTFGRNEARGLTALPDGGFAAVVTDGSSGTWIVRGPPSGGAGTCTRVDAWWATTTSTRTVTAKTATTNALALTAASILLTPEPITVTRSEICTAPSY